MKLSNTARAIVDVRKLRDYCLSREHPRGQHKARVFQSALGWTAASAEEIRGRLLEVVQREEVTFLGSDDYGKRYALDFSVHGPAGPVTVRSLWIVRRDEDFPRFASCYIL
ncbi:MAG: hypothetical protein R3B95_17860 [Nitrospirales bacterium]|nr:hypothetical protein [Nitrospirales bacterium]